MFSTEPIILLVVLLGVILFPDAATRSLERAAPPPADTTLSRSAPPPLSADARAWTGDYRGRIDGRRARLKIEAAPDDRRLVVTLTDASNSVLRGSVYGSELSVRSPHHVMPPIHLSSPGCTPAGPACRRLVLQRLHLHTWGRERRISGRARDGQQTVGVMFTEGRLPAPRTARPAAPFSARDAASVWPGRYTGRLDGRPATLTIRRVGAAFRITLTDPDDGPAYAGEMPAHRVQGHVLTIPALIAPDGRAVTRVRLYLHTQDTGYVSGTATVRHGGRPGVTAGLYAVRIGDSRPVADR